MKYTHFFKDDDVDIFLDGNVWWWCKFVSEYHKYQISALVYTFNQLQTPSAEALKILRYLVQGVGVNGSPHTKRSCEPQEPCKYHGDPPDVEDRKNVFVLGNQYSYPIKKGVVGKNG